jgi:hypothetical protein
VHIDEAILVGSPSEQYDEPSLYVELRPLWRRRAMLLALAFHRIGFAAAARSSAGAEPLAGRVAAHRARNS